MCACGVALLFIVHVQFGYVVFSRAERVVSIFRDCEWAVLESRFMNRSPGVDLAAAWLASTCWGSKRATKFNFSSCRTEFASLLLFRKKKRKTEEEMWRDNVKERKYIGRGGWLAKSCEYSFLCIYCYFWAVLLLCYCDNWMIAFCSVLYCTVSATSIFSVGHLLFALSYQSGCMLGE